MSSFSLQLNSPKLVIVEELLEVLVVEFVPGFLDLFLTVCVCVLCMSRIYSVMYFCSNSCCYRRMEGKVVFSCS